jgi:hypothetical protein
VLNTAGNFFLFFLLFVLSKGLLAAKGEAIYSSSKIESIRNSRAWQKLLHLEPNSLGIKHRQLPDKNFYLSNNQELNEDDEVRATLKSFNLSLESFEKEIQHPLIKNEKKIILDHSQHPQCRFPARLKFLKSELQEYSDYWNSLPTPNCVFKEIFLNALDAKSISFVFSSYYADSPGSAFGHTFFRVNRKSNSGVGRQELLDYGIGFAANVTVTNPALYALLGLTGGFDGTWTNLPYYYKVREYNDFEARDLWSYDLNLSENEVEMLVLHMWEVGAHRYRYFFFTQNCAYHMLTVLEAAAPRLNLTEHIPFYYVIPADSLKALFYEQNLVGETSYRPSIRNVFLDRLRLLDEDTLNNFKKYQLNVSSIEEAALTGLSEKQKSRYLDAALDLFDLKNPNIDFDKNRSLYLEKEKLLAIRAKLNSISEKLITPLPEADRPENSHGSSRAALKWFRKDNIETGHLNYRFALHDLQDPINGLPAYSQLEFFNFDFQVVPNQVLLHEFNLFKVLNLNPNEFFEDNKSWGFELGVQNLKQYCSVPTEACYLYGAKAKYGLSQKTPTNELLGWALATLNLRHGPELNKSTTYAAIGFETGLLFRFSSSKSLLARYSREYSQERNDLEDYEVEARFGVFKSLSLGLATKNQSFSTALYYYY